MYSRVEDVVQAGYSKVTLVFRWFSWMQRGRFGVEHNAMGMFKALGMGSALV